MIKPSGTARRSLSLLLVVAAALSPSLAAAQTENPTDYVLLVDKLVTFGRSASVATGNVAVSMPASLGGIGMFAERLFVSGDAVYLVSDKVELKNPASVYAVFANTTLLGPDVVVRAPCGMGACTFPPPVFNPFPSLAAITPGTMSITVPAKTTMTLAPGSYGRLRLRGRSTVVFTGGTYNFSEIKTGRIARLLFAAPTTVNVAGRLQFGTSNVVGPIGPAPHPRDILFNVTGDKVRIRPRSTVSARVWAPASKLQVGFGGLIKGQLVAFEAKIDRGTVLQTSYPVGPFEVRTNTPTITPVPTDTSPPTATPTETPLPTETETAAPTVTETAMPTATDTHTAVPTPTDTHTAVPTPTDTQTALPTPTDTHTAVPTVTDTPQPTSTGTLPPSTSTFTPQPTETFTQTGTPTNTAVNTATNTPVNTATNTPVNTATNTPVNTATNTPVNTATNTPVNTATNTPVNTSTLTATRTLTHTAVPPTPTATTACAAPISVGSTNYDQVAFINNVLGGTVNQVGGTSPGASMLVAADFQGTVSASTGVSVTAGGYIFGSSVVAQSLAGNSEPGNLPSVALGAPTDITFTAPGSGGPDGTDGDGSLVMGASGNFITFGFGTTICADPCEPHILTVFTDTAGTGTGTIELLMGGSVVASVSTAFPGGAVESGLGGMSFVVDGVTFEHVRITRLSGTVEIDAVAVKASAACGGGGASFAICSDGTRQGGEECDDGNTVNGDGCSSDCRNEYDSMLGARYCTLSQGGWGAAAGEPFLDRAPEILPVSIGGPDFSTTLHSEAALQEYLPRGGTANELYAGERHFVTAGDVVDDGGGVLAGQAVALTLSASLSSTGEVYENLGALGLTTQPFCTQGLSEGVDGLIGTADDTVDAGSAVSGPFSVPASVAGGSNTVSDLLIMANQYLRGGDSAPSITDVNTALNAMNLAFDGCRQVVACP